MYHAPEYLAVADEMESFYQSAKKSLCRLRLTWPDTKDRWWFIANNGRPYYVTKAWLEGYNSKSDNNPYSLSAMPDKYNKWLSGNMIAFQIAKDQVGYTY